VAEGHVFHRSDNGVWLTAEVPSQHLSVKRTNT
jgi:putative RNA 2'-phosphotransferase